jgi:hypothetical protein
LAAQAAVQTAILALGGDNLRGVQSCIAQGQMKRNSSTGTFKWESSGKDFRFEETVDSTTSAFVSNHGTPASIFGSRVKYWPPHFGVANFVPPMIGNRLLQYSADLTVGMASLISHPGADSGILRVQIAFPQHADAQARKIQQEWRFNETSGLPVAVRLTMPGYPIGSIGPVAESTFSKFEAFEGVLMPMHIDQYLGKSLMSSYDIKSVQCNVTVDPTDFTVPAGAQ